MKPFLLMLLLAIPPLISGVLSFEDAEKTDAPAGAPCVPAPKDIAPATSATPAKPATAVMPSAAPAAKPASRGGATTGLKAWFMM